MFRIAALLALLTLLAFPAQADTIVAARTIRSQATITATDVAVVEGEVANTYVSLDEVLGLEARVALYAGRPIRIGDLGPPAIVERNQVVALTFSLGTLTIASQGRTLARGGIGDSIRVMNLDSRQIVSGIVQQDGSVNVGPAAPIVPLQERTK